MDNPYKRAMGQLSFDKDFEDRTAALLEGISKKKRRAKVAKSIAYCVTAAACTALIVLAAWFFSGNGAAGMENPIAAVPTELHPSESPAEVVIATPDERVVAVSSEYGSELSSYKTPDPGEVLITGEVRRALEDRANDAAYFFVRIYVIPPEQYANEAGKYIYNGRTVKEWRELVDLSKGEYPYSEYNGDHGGDITKEQFEELQWQAKTQKAQQNLDAAMAEYNAEIVPLIDQAREVWKKTEADRLKALGYDVFLMDTWTYRNAGEKEDVKILAGVFSGQQITCFAASNDCGYTIEWVHNGDGVLDWEEYKTETEK